MENSHSYRWEKRVTPNSMLTPGKGPLIRLYDTPFYHQTINRKLCYRNERSSQSPFCESGVCRQKYAKQNILAQEIDIKNTFQIVLQDIWVPSGCEFVILDENFVKDRVQENINKSWSGITEIRVIRSDFEMIDRTLHDVLNSRASLANINGFYFLFLWPFMVWAISL